MFYLILLGLVAGFLSGLLGIGGGVITVPALYYTFILQGHSEHPMQIAVATSLAAVLITTSVATFVHMRNGKHIILPILGYLLPGLIIGCISGAELAHYLPTTKLRMIFGVVAFLI